MAQTTPIPGMSPWILKQYPFRLDGPDLMPYYWKKEMEDLKKMGLTPGSPVAPPPVREKEAEALKKKFLEEQQQQIKASSIYQSRTRVDPGRALSPIATVFKRPLTHSSTLALSLALPAMVKNPHPLPVHPVGKVKMVSGVLGQILLVLTGLLAGFFLLTKILKY